MQNEVSSDVYEGEIQAKKGREGNKGKRRKKKRMRDSLDQGGSDLYFLKF